MYGNAVRAFLQRIRSDPERYREVIVCTPYLDERTIAEVREVGTLAMKVRCTFCLITKAAAAQDVLQHCSKSPSDWRNIVRVRPRLHAKVYFALARLHRNSEVIVTSANLTLDGVSKNEELGIRFTGQTAIDRTVLAKVYSIIQKWIH